MARAEANIGSIVTPAGTVTVSIFYDSAKVTSSSHIPAANRCFISIGSLSEMPEYEAGVIEIGTLDIKLKEFFDVYPGGLFNKMFESDTEFRFYLNEGSGNTFYFWGMKVDTQINFSEVFDDGFYKYRTISMSLNSMLTKIANTSVTDIIATIKANVTTYEQHTPFIGHYHDVVSVFELFGCIYQTAFGSTDVDGNLANTVRYDVSADDIQLYVEETGFITGWYGLKDFYIPVKNESQNISAPDSPHFTDQDDQLNGTYYWGNRFANGMELLAFLCRNFGVIPRYSYGMQAGGISGTASENKHRLELLQRGRDGVMRTMPEIIESSYDYAMDIKPKAYRVRMNNGIAVDSFDGFDITLDFGDVNFMHDFQKIMLLLEDQGDFTHYLTYPSYPVSRIWDYIAGNYAVTSENVPFIDAMKAYYEGRFSKNSRVYRRRYFSLKPTVETVSSHALMRPYCRTEINDGGTNRIVYAYEAVKNMEDNTLEVQWVEE